MTLNKLFDASTNGAPCDASFTTPELHTRKSSHMAPAALALTQYVLTLINIFSSIPLNLS